MDSITAPAGSQPRRRNLNHQSASRLVAEWQASGDSAEKFAASVGTTAKTLLRWQRRLAGEASAVQARLCRVEPAAPTHRSMGLVVEARCGVRVLLPADCSEAQLQLAMRVAATC